MSKPSIVNIGCTGKPARVPAEMLAEDRAHLHAIPTEPQTGCARNLHQNIATEIRMRLWVG